MRHRLGVTLIEVLVTIFIMGIGMLALLVLFPLGAVSMAQALRDDRTASSAVIAENIALAFDIRHDPLFYGTGSPFTQGTSPGPSNPVYVDAWGASVGGGPVPGAAGTSIPRVSPSFLTAVGGGPQRWFTLLDDITFTNAPGDGTPDLSPGYIQRAGWYTWAYMLQRPNAGTDAVVNLSIVVYQKRPLGLPPSEFPYAAAGSAGSNTVILSWTSGPAPAIRRNSWLLDMSSLPTGVVPHGDFYRVINVTDNGIGVNQVTVELEKNLRYDTDSMTVMQDVVDVFDKGPSWQP